MCAHVLFTAAQTPAIIEVEAAERNVENWNEQQVREWVERMKTKYGLGSKVDTLVFSGSVIAGLTKEEFVQMTDSRSGIYLFKAMQELLRSALVCVPLFFALVQLFKSI